MQSNNQANNRNYMPQPASWNANMNLGMPNGMANGIANGMGASQMGQVGMIPDNYMLAQRAMQIAQCPTIQYPHLDANGIKPGTAMSMGQQGNGYSTPHPVNCKCRNMSNQSFQGQPTGFSSISQGGGQSSGFSSMSQGGGGLSSGYSSMPLGGGQQSGFSCMPPCGDMSGFTSMQSGGPQVIPVGNLNCMQPIDLSGNAGMFGSNYRPQPYIEPGICLSNDQWNAICKYDSNIKQGLPKSENKTNMQNKR